MNFSLSEEQKMLKDSVDRFLEKNYSFDLRQSMIEERQTMSGEVWEGLAGLGLLGVSFPEEYGGFGGGGIETMLIMESMGNHLVIEPYVSTVILAGGLVNKGAADWQKQIILPGIIDGSMLISFAHMEPGSRFNLERVQTVAKPDGNNWVLEGQKSIVLHGPVAEKLIVSARTSGEVEDQDGVTLFIVECDEENLGGHEYPLYDGTRALDVQLNGVRVGPESVIGQLGKAMPLISEVVDHAMAAFCAEAVGVMERTQQMTLEYLKTRKQFGVPISRFQVLQHRAVDMFITLEQARSMAVLASGSLASTDLSEKKKAILAAKDFIGRAGRAVGQEAIQLHGGMGMTQELAIGHYFKRLEAIDLMFGNSQHQRREFAKLSNQEGPVEYVQPRKKWKQI